MENKELRSGESAADYCVRCKGLLAIEEEATCKYCVINMAN